MLRNNDARNTVLATVGITAAVAAAGLIAFWFLFADHNNCPFVYAFDGHDYVFDAQPLLVATARLARELLFSSSLSADGVQGYGERLQQESYLAFLDMLALDLPRPHRVTTPLLVLGAGRDALFRPSEVEATARAYRTRAVVFADMAHDMMLDAGWRMVADRMLAWLTNRGL